MFILNVNLTFDNMKLCFPNMLKGSACLALLVYWETLASLTEPISDVSDIYFQKYYSNVSDINILPIYR